MKDILNSKLIIRWQLIMPYLFSIHINNAQCFNHRNLSLSVNFCLLIWSFQMRIQMAFEMMAFREAFTTVIAVILFLSTMSQKMTWQNMRVCERFSTSLTNIRPFPWKIERLNYIQDFPSSKSHLYAEIFRAWCDCQSLRTFSRNSGNHTASHRNGCEWWILKISFNR